MSSRLPDGIQKRQYTLTGHIMTITIKTMVLTNFYSLMWVVHQVYLCISEESSDVNPDAVPYEEALKETGIVWCIQGLWLARSKIKDIV